MSRIRFAAAGAALACVLPLSAAMAEDGAERDSYFSVMGLYTITDEDRVPHERGEFEGDDYGAGVRINYGRQGQRWGWGVGYESQVIETDISGFQDFYRHALDLHLTRSLFGNREGFTPYALIGIGGNYNDVRQLSGANPEEDDGFDVFGTAGLGFVTGTFGESPMRLRGEARYTHDEFNDGMGDIQFGLGVEISLSRPTAEVREVTAEPEVQVVEVPQDLQDSDGDGIPDMFDQCPGTAAGTRVDSVGCPLEDTLRIHGVLFDFDSDRLHPNARRLLDPVAEIFSRYPDLQVEIAGHTDNIGSADYNQDLSDRRAESVREYLVSQGIASSNLTTAGYGFSEPMASNDTEEGRQENRRVEIRILN